MNRVDGVVRAGGHGGNGVGGARHGDGPRRGFAFVEMGSDEEAQAAINQVNSVELADAR